MKKRNPKFGLTQSNGWYEAVDTGSEARLIRNVKEAEGHRCFFRGPIGKVMLVEVPDDMTQDARTALGKALSAQGISVLLLNERIKFFRLQRVSQEEERLLNAIDHREANPQPETAEQPDTGDGDGGSELRVSER